MPIKLEQNIHQGYFLQTLDDVGKWINNTHNNLIAAGLVQTADTGQVVSVSEGVPAQTEILVFLHRNPGEPGDGKLIKRITTFQSGSWRVGNLNPDLHYDVVCRYPGYKDEIMSNIKPFVE